MGISFAIGSSNYAALAQGANSYAMSCKPDSPTYENRRIHVPGTDGNYMIRLGKSGGKIRLMARYIGNGYAAIEALFQADCAAFANTAVNITYAGATFQRCNLDPGGGRKVKDPAPLDGAGNAWMDAEFTFSQDG